MRGRSAGAVAIVVTAEHADVVVEAHVEGAILVLIPAHQPHFQAADEHLADLVDAHLGVVLCPALDLLWVGAESPPCCSDVLKRLHVPTLDA